MVSVTPEPMKTEVSTSTMTADAGASIIVNHTSVELFEQIPDKYLEAARNLHMMWADRSVGQNINEALDCLTAQSWSSSPAHCRRDYYSTDNSSWEWKTYTSSAQAPAQILFNPNPEKYNRSNWIFEIQGGEWESLIQDFVVRLVPAYVQDSDVLSFQITYLNVEHGSDIDDPTTILSRTGR